MWLPMKKQVIHSKHIILTFKPVKTMIRISASVADASFSKQQPDVSVTAQKLVLCVNYKGHIYVY